MVDQHEGEQQRQGGHDDEDTVPPKTRLALDELLPALHTTTSGCCDELWVVFAHHRGDLRAFPSKSRNFNVASAA